MPLMDRVKKKKREKWRVRCRDITCNKGNRLENWQHCSYPAIKVLLFLKFYDLQNPKFEVYFVFLYLSVFCAARIQSKRDIFNLTEVFLPPPKKGWITSTTMKRAEKRTPRYETSTKFTTTYVTAVRAWRNIWQHVLMNLRTTLLITVASPETNPSPDYTQTSMATHSSGDRRNKLP